MTVGKVSEQEIIQALHRIPFEQWSDVLRFMQAMQMNSLRQRNGISPVQTGVDLRGSGLIGIWADRTDIGDTRDFARQLRQQASQRRGVADDAGH